MQMTDEAQKQWNNFSVEEQARLLSGIWCMGCASATSMTVDTGNTGKYGLVLRGKCTACQGQVSRVVHLPS